MGADEVHNVPVEADDGGGDRGAPVDVSLVLTPASPTLLSETVADRLRDTIFKGHFAPGERLREEQLAEALDVSRGPIRDALLQLEREGLVVRRRNRGAMVARLSLADLEEVYSLRLAIEPFVCAWAARNADEQDYAEMQAAIDSYSTLDSSVTAHEAADADLRFHDVLYRAARHKRVLRLWGDLRPQVYIFLLARTYVGQAEFRDIMIRSHGALLAAIEEHDEERVRELAVEHVQTSYRRVIAGYQEDGDSPQATEG
jgi:DNA-binding GntR family transcriptional regulator